MQNLPETQKECAQAEEDEAEKVQEAEEEEEDEKVEEEEEDAKVDDLTEGGGERTHKGDEKGDEGKDEDEGEAEEKKEDEGRVMKRPANPFGLMRLCKKMKLLAVEECFMVTAKTGQIRCYLLAKCGDKKSQFLCISQNESPHYQNLVKNLHLQAEERIQAGIAFDDLKAWASRQKQQLIW